MSKPHKVALYMRVSREDNNAESNSITNQRKLLNDYLNSYKDLVFETVEEYCDDGLTGTNFDRPQFIAMMQKVKNKKLDCLICKDFSRLGRNYIEVSDYLEQIFPFLGVRFISVNDNYDSAKDKYNIRMDVSFKNLLNDYYSKDLSNKIRTSYKARVLSGKQVPSTPAFGYDVVKDKQSKIVIDEYSSQVVKRIFEMVMDGHRTTEIAKTLNDENVPTPNIYKKQKYNYKITKDNFWRSRTICGVIKDRRYIGKGSYLKKEKVEIGKNKYRRIPKNEWIEIDNNHPPIISEEIFEQASLRLNNYFDSKDKIKKPRLLFDKVKCHCCGYTMERSKSAKPKYICKTPNFKDYPSCITTPINEVDIESVILNAIQTKIKLVIDQQEVKNILKQKYKQNKIDVVSKLKKLQLSIKNLNQLKFTTYEKYKDCKISQEDFKKEKLHLDNQIESFELELKELELAKDEDNKDNINTKTPLLQFIDTGEAITELTREIVDTLIEKVVIYDTNEFEIVWKFDDIFI